MTSEDQTDRIQQLEKRIEELENKQQLSKYSRRGLLGGIAGVAGLGAMSGSGAAASGQVGTANNRVNVFADNVDIRKSGAVMNTATNQTFPSNTDTTVAFDNVRLTDPDGISDLSNNRMTVQRDGRYLVSGGVTWGIALPSGTDVRIEILKNNSKAGVFVERTNRTIKPAGNFEQNITQILPLLAGDDVQIQCRYSGSSQSPVLRTAALQLVQFA